MLNLLPPQQKKELRLDFLNQVVVIVAIAIVFMILVLLLLLLVAQSFLDMNLDETERELNFWQSKAEIKELKNLEEKVKELNRNLTFLDEKQRKQIIFSSFLENLAKDTPPGVRFDSISINESNQVIIKGYASFRDNLLVLKDNLESASYVNNLDFPLANLTKSADINFSLSFKYGL